MISLIRDNIKKSFAIYILTKYKKKKGQIVF